jgi:hypothetical protein
MLRIIVELVPGGVESRKRELARADLGNITALDPVSDYQIRAREGDNPVAGAKAWESRGLITGHDREVSVWRLVEKAAHWAVGEAGKQ